MQLDSKTQNNSTLLSELLREVYSCEFCKSFKEHMDCVWDEIQGMTEYTDKKRKNKVLKFADLYEDYLKGNL